MKSGICADRKKAGRLDAIGYTGGVSVEGRFSDPYADSCREAVRILKREYELVIGSTT